MKPTNRTGHVPISFSRFVEAQISPSGNVKNPKSDRSDPPYFTTCIDVCGGRRHLLGNVKSTNRTGQIPISLLPGSVGADISFWQCETKIGYIRPLLYNGLVFFRAGVFLICVLCHPQDRVDHVYDSGICTTRLLRPFLTGWWDLPGMHVRVRCGCGTSTHVGKRRICQTICSCSVLWGTLL